MADWTVGTGLVLSDIVLKDKYASPVTHEDITRIDADMADGRVQPYHDLAALRCYVMEPNGDLYTVKTQFAPAWYGFFPGNHGVMSMFTTGMLDEYGFDKGSGDSVERACILLFTLKTLTVGESYTSNYLLEQGGE